MPKSRRIIRTYERARYWRHGLLNSLTSMRVEQAVALSDTEKQQLRQAWADVYRAVETLEHILVPKLGAAFLSELKAADRRN